MTWKQGALALLVWFYTTIIICCLVAGDHMKTTERINVTKTVFVADTGVTMDFDKQEMRVKRPQPKRPAPPEGDQHITRS